MDFEHIGGGRTSSQYSLYDYTDNQNGETVMAIDVHHESGEWWFVGEPKGNMNVAHMDALRTLLEGLHKSKEKGGLYIWSGHSTSTTR